MEVPGTPAVLFMDIRFYGMQLKPVLVSDVLSAAGEAARSGRCVADRP